MGKVDCSIENGIATVVFTNPPKGFFTADMVDQLGRIMTDLEDDNDVRVIIFTGGLDDVFIRHFSVEEIIGMTIRDECIAREWARIGHASTSDEQEQNYYQKHCIFMSL